MSFTADHESNDVRRPCQFCDERNAKPALSGVEGLRLSEADSTRRVLCFECYRAAREGSQAPKAAVESALRPLYLPGDFRGRTLTDREVAHRQQMLAHLASARRA